MRGAIAILTAAVVLVAAGGAKAQLPEPNDDFASRVILDPAVRIVSDSLTASAGGGGPDTTLGAFTQGGSLIDWNDDASPFGDGYASALYEITVNSDGSIRLKVSGAEDYNFDGNDDYWGDPHEQSGPYDLYVTVFDSGDNQIDSQTLNGNLTAGNVVSHTLTGYGASNYFQAEIDNTPSSADDALDFMTFTSLPAGEHFEARTVVTAGGFDTVLGWFDDDGDLIAYDDDSGPGSMLSNIGGTVPGNGNLHLAVTGYADVLFQGNHLQSGNYELEVLLPPAGDATLDMAVDGADYTVWADHYETTDMLWIEGDWTGDGIVDGADYTVWADNYGTGTSPAPEPMALGLLALGALGVLSRRRRS